MEWLILYHRSSCLLEKTRDEEPEAFCSPLLRSHVGILGRICFGNCLWLTAEQTNRRLILANSWKASPIAMNKHVFSFS